MILAEDQARFEALLPDLHALGHTLAARHAGPRVLHLDAAIAALEGHLRRGGETLEQLRAEPSRAAPRSEEPVTPAAPAE